jgi:hypothetical protein
MKRVVAGIVALGLMLSFGTLAFAASKSTHAYKVGEQVYVCGCGEGCDCYTISRKEGKCTCDKDLVKAKVTKVSSKVVTVKADDWEKTRDFKALGGYKCACGKDCKCDTISQKPGKCVCGVGMKKS